MSANTFILKEFPNQSLIKNIWTHPDIWITQRDEVRNYCDLYKVSPSCETLYKSRQKHSLCIKN